MILRQHFLAEQFVPPLSGPGHRAEPLGVTNSVEQNFFNFLDDSDQKEHILFFLKNDILLSNGPRCFALGPGPGECRRCVIWYASIIYFILNKRQIKVNRNQTCQYGCP